ncbi:hypothetical protein CCC_02440 [Paramagnetospirillum magnetotacticum MS-1]|uniref:Secreted protein n=1 Tax=Paramagnetospirillum magnetotacticum MS-1 TaxID=272627 RepID=A0A0C2YWB3_PARME|nr:hypothetical protein [Paramagnetospirillum magnetotacticum]KIL98990.1 hypothetical protein CCC_02440 [Paramagnetospirillum magnetotacticum MS-1]
MTMSGLLRVAVAVLLSAGLSGCAVAELAAHGVKEIEKRNRGDQSSQTASQQSAQPQSRTEEEPPPPARAPATRSSSSVTVEELPPR